MTTSEIRTLSDEELNKIATELFAICTRLKSEREQAVDKWIPYYDEQKRRINRAKIIKELEEENATKNGTSTKERSS